MDMDRAHIDKTTKYYTQTGSALEFAEYEKKRKTKEYMEKRLRKG
jgi:hypothetical protein